MNISVTPAAAVHIKRIVPEGNPVRLRLQHGGCAGVKYIFAVEPPQLDDISLLFDGIRVSVAAADAAALDGTIIDCIEDGAGTRMTFNNPRETARCGCGLSVALPAQA